VNEGNYWQRLRSGRISRRAFVGASLTTGAALATAAVIGCGGDDKDSGGAPSVEKDTGQPILGGTLIFNTNTDADHLDVHISPNIATASSTSGLAYSRLFRKKLGKGGLPDVLVAEGDLVESYEQPEPNVYIFHLRKGVKFHNVAPVNGRDLVANDVIQSFERQRASRTNSAILAEVASWTAVDDSTLRFQLSAQNADFLLNLTEPRAPVIPHESWEQSSTGDLKQGPIIGTGACIFKSWSLSQPAILAKNPQYYREGLPYADGLTVLRIFDPQTAQAALRTGQVHALGPVSGQQATILKQTRPFKEQVGGVFGTLGGLKVWMHGAKAPATDIRVRQAVSKAINRQAFVDAVAFGNGYVNAISAVPDREWLLPDSEARTLLAQDIPGARQLLQQANFGSWSPTFFAGVRFFAYVIPGAELLTAQLQEIGVTVNILPVDGPTINQNFARGDTDGGYGTLNPGASPTLVLERFYKSDGTSNGYKLKDSQLDSLIARQKTLLDEPEERKKVFQDIQRRVMETAVVVPVYVQDDPVLIAPELKNYFPATLENAQYEIAWLGASS